MIEKCEKSFYAEKERRKGAYMVELNSKDE
jgi:hypothetical protein